MEQSCFWIVVPALNEELVVADTVRSLLALEAPGIRLRVLVVDDGSTDRTSEVLEAIDDDRLVVLRRAPPDARNGKGAVLNAAYRLIREVARREGTVRGTVVGVIDADGRSSRDMLTEVSRYLADPAVGAVQCQVRIRNRHTGLGLLQDIEFGCVADSAQVLRDALGSVALGGNGQFTRLSVLMRLGDCPWSSCLVEDVELGLRLHRAGIGIRYARRATVSQQAVVDVRRLVRQRGRWAQGNLQCLRHVPGLLGSQRVTSLGLLDFLHYLIAPWLVPPVSMLALVLLGLGICGRLGVLPPTPLVAGPADLPVALTMGWTALLLPGLVWGLTHWLRLRDEPLWRCLLISLSYPMFLMLGAIASCVGIARHLARRDDWMKTERLVEGS
jgi:cellulose synthase/poly-beta-1,6-N-acetylglucosamine synthase-like glycosyltransferase